MNNKKISLSYQNAYISVNMYDDSSSLKAIFSNSGPNISIKAIPISSYKSNIYTKTKSLGINNSNFEVYVNIKIDVQTLIPLKEQSINYESNVLLGSILIQGEIPYYYYYSGTGTIEALPQ